MQLREVLQKWIDEKKSSATWNTNSAKTATKWARLFARFLKNHCHVHTLEQITLENLMRYKQCLQSKKPNTRHNAESMLFSFFNWCIDVGWLLSSPLIGWKRIGSVGPIDRGLSIEQIQTILNTMKTSTVQQIRDRTVIETFYATAIRRMELRRLDVEDVDLAAGRIWIHHGKGDKGRIVPIINRALHWMRRYLKEARWQLVKDTRCRALFIGVNGKRIGDGSLDHLMRKLRQSTNISPISPHVFRHSCATHLMQAGVPLRYLQEFLGHSDISSTQYYLQVTAVELKEKYRLAHPRDQWD